MAGKKWFWATLALSSTTIMLVVFAAWELVENHFFRDATYLSLHALYITRGIASSMMLAFWAAWFVLRQRRQSEEDLRRSHERYRGLIEVIPGAVVLYDSSLVVLEWNASAERMYGYVKAEIQGKPLPTVPVEKMDELEIFLSRVRQGKLVLDVETTRAARQGGPFEVLLSLIPFQEPTGETHFLEVTSDIRERVRWRERMLQIEKLTSMGKMAAGTAHHLNSPLAAMVLRVQMMEERGHSSPEDLERLEKGLEFCRHFVQRLLEFTRASSLQKQPQELSTLLESVADFFLPVIRAKGASLEVDAAGSRGLSVFADRNQLETVLLILLSNALDAVEEGGWIRIRSCREEASNRAVFEIADNGTGISPANLEHVFEPFFTTKEPGKGTGLGLAIARNVILEHGGTIEISSEPGMGATVRVELPLAETAYGDQAAA